MAHEFETGFFVREPAWHQLGNILTDAPTTEEAYEKSGLNWEVKKYPLHYYYHNMEMTSERFAIVREVKKNLELKILLMVL